MICLRGYDGAFPATPPSRETAAVGSREAAGDPRESRGAPERGGGRERPSFPYSP